MTAPRDWCEDEPPTRRGMVTELQRFKRRAESRPWPLLLVALVVAAGLTWHVVRKPRLVEADVVLALIEGEVGARELALPVDQLRAYVETVLLSDSRLRELIERRDLYPKRRQLGMEFAIAQLRDQLEITVTRNSFLDDDPSGGPRSARVELAVIDADPERASQLARDLADLAIATEDAHRQRYATQLAAALGRTRAALTARLADLDEALAARRAALAAAAALPAARGGAGSASDDDAPASDPTAADHVDPVAADRTQRATLDLEIASLLNTQRAVEEQLSRTAGSDADIMARLTAAGLDTRLERVEEQRPDPPQTHGAVIAGLAIVLFVVALIVAVVLFGTFDGRIHDGDDVSRLGLPLLGELPAFRGDDVGALRGRGIPRQR